MKFYRTYEWKGKEEKEACVEAESELDAETEFFYFEQDLTREDNSNRFEWTSSIYDLKTKVELQEIKK